MKHRRKLALAAALSAVLLIASTTDAWAAGTGKIRAIAAQLLEDLGITTGGVYTPGGVAADQEFDSLLLDAASQDVVLSRSAAETFRIASGSAASSRLDVDVSRTADLYVSALQDSGLPARLRFNNTDLWFDTRAGVIFSELGQQYCEFTMGAAGDFSGFFGAGGSWLSLGTGISTQYSAAPAIGGELVATHRLGFLATMSNVPWVLTDKANASKDHGHVVVADPTFFVHSADDVDADDSLWLSVHHDGVDGRIETGSGDLVLASASGNVTLGAAVRINDLLASNLVESSTAVAASPNILTAAESLTILKTGAITATNYHTLPTAAAGLSCSFAADDATDLIRITAAAGDTVEIAGAVSALAGYAESFSAGGTTEFITFLATDATQWVATSLRGEWTVDGVPANHQHAEYSIANADKVATAAITPGAPVEAGSTATATAGEAHGFTIDTTNGGRATYDGGATKLFSVTATISMTAGSNNIIFLLYVAKNGAVETQSVVRRKIATGGDVGAASIQTLLSLATNDYVEVYVDATSGTPTFTAETLNVNISTVSSN